MNTPTLESRLLPSDDEFEKIKQHLFERIAKSETRRSPELVVLRPPVRRPRRARWLVASGMAAALFAGALALGNLGIAPTPAAHAADVLHAAARAAISYSDPVVGPGQYLKVETTDSGMTATKDGYYDQPRLYTWYIPYDRSDTWYRTEQSLKVNKVYGSDPATITKDATAPTVGQPPVTSIPGGPFASSKPEANDIAAIARLPHDPVALRAYLYAHAEGSSSNDEAVWVRISDLLSWGLVPATLRSAMYDVLATIPGAHVTDDVANLNGSTGVAIGRKEPARPYTDEIILNPATGLLIGTREVGTTTVGPVPVGAIWDWSAVTTSVVGQAPLGAGAKEGANG